MRVTHVLWDVFVHQQQTSACALCDVTNINVTARAPLLIDWVPTRTTTRTSSSSVVRDARGVVVGVTLSLATTHTHQQGEYNRYAWAAAMAACGATQGLQRAGAVRLTIPR